MAAPTIAIFDFPASVNRNFNSTINGLYLNATSLNAASAGMKKALRKLERPIFDMVARARNDVPDCRDLGATPTNAARALAFLNCVMLANSERTTLMVASPMPGTVETRERNLQ